MIVNEIVTKFSFVGNNNKLIDYNATLKDTLKNIKNMTLKVAGAVAGLNAFAIMSTKSVSKLEHLSHEIDVSAEKMQKLTVQARLTHSSFDAMVSSLNNLSKKLSNASLFGDSDFSMLGIAIYNDNNELKKADQILDEIRFKLKDFSNAQQMSILSKFGIDASLITMLRKTKKEFSDLEQEASNYLTITQASTKDLANYEDQLERFKLLFTSLQQNIALGLLPHLEEMNKQFIDFFKGGDGEKNIDLILKKSEQFGAVLRSITASLKDTLPTFFKVGAVAFFTIALGGLLGRLGQIFTSAKALFKTLKKGSDTVSKTAKSITALSGVLKVLVGISAMFFSPLKTVGLFLFFDDLLAYLDNANNKITLIGRTIDYLKEKFQALNDFLTPILKPIQEFFGGTDIEQQTSFNYSRRDMIPNMPTPSSKSENNKVDIAKTQNNNITINTNNPDIMKNEVNKVLQDDMRNVSDQVLLGGF